MPSAPHDPIEQLNPIEREAQAWVARFASGKATAAEIDALKRWYDQSAAHAAAFDKAERLWERLGPAAALHVRDSTPSVERSIAVLNRLPRRAVLGGALAASAAALGYGIISPPLDLWPSIKELRADYRTATGERKQIALNDFLIDMSAATSIAVRSTQSNPHHFELIAGEAAISLRRDFTGSFALSAGSGQTIARRASFDVRYIGANVCVTCLDGELRVEQQGAAANLEAGQQLLYSLDAMSSVRTVDPATVTSWRDGFLVFHATPLAEAIEQVNRYRRGKIVLMNEALGERLFSARFRIENIDEIVDQIRQVFDARVTSLPGGLIVIS
ncbi:MAG: FecR domain-containing protein [Pseudomonadota bacterium]